MPQLGPHISIPDDKLLSRVFGLTPQDFDAWPEGVRHLAASLASELFLVRYNPFISPDWVRQSVKRRLNIARPSLSGEFPSVLSRCVDGFWEAFEADQDFKAEVLQRLKADKVLPSQAVSAEPHSLVECSTDATDLRLELPMAVLFPETTAQVQAIVRLANEMEFGIVPRGGGTGLTGGAIPGRPRSVILSLSRMKQITEVSEKDMRICAQAGVITLTAIKAAEEKGLLFTVDPASKSASSIGGNVSENSGGPFAFEYGTTIDNIASYTMVSPTGEIIKVQRVEHPGHKIFSDETARFEILDQEGRVTETLALSGTELRKKGLGKDVSDKFLGGLPGVQKEGVDGIITEACFVLHPRPAHSRVLCLEFFGRTMQNAMLVITDVVRLRDAIREAGDKVKISALEEFGPKYVKAIEYAKKSSTYEGDPISVLILQLDSDDEQALTESVQAILDIARPYDNVDVFAARDPKEAELFWEDRHKLSAIAKRTSGFKINEDVVIPLKAIPDFSNFLENLNLVYLAKAFRRALNRIVDLSGVKDGDDLIEEQRRYCIAILRREISVPETSDQELELHIRQFSYALKDRYPRLEREIDKQFEKMAATRIEIANHMHAGDGNCHVNLPVNSNDPEMLAQAHEAVEEVFAKVLELGGEVSGEHGIGITKIAFLDDAKIKALAEYKKKVDPADVLNPGKLTKKLMPVAPYTFSFNRLIRDLDTTALKDKEMLIELLRNIQACTRCSKCKQVCPMYHPQSGLLHHPRNKNISLGALIEAIFYSQHKDGKPDPGLLDRLRRLMEHCTACGKCMSVCPIKIDSARAALSMRAFLAEKGHSGHGLKNTILTRLAHDPSSLVPKAAKALSVAQSVHNKTLALLPAPWKSRILKNPALHGPGPHVDFLSLYDFVKPDKGTLFFSGGPRSFEGVLYFPGCGSGLFARSTGLAAIYLLLKAQVSVALPDRHLCCGYPLLSSGCVEAYNTNRHQTTLALQETLARASVEGMQAGHILTSCGTCRESVTHYGLDREVPHGIEYMDVAQFVLERLPGLSRGKRPPLFHAACHAEWQGIPAAKSAEAYRKALSGVLGAPVDLSEGCCGESGLGALTSPDIYNRIRERKKSTLAGDLQGRDKNDPVLVGCPSCRVAIRRSLMQMHRPNPVMHVLEYLAELAGGPKWKKELRLMLDTARQRRAQSVA